MQFEGLLLNVRKIRKSGIGTENRSFSAFKRWNEGIHVTIQFLVQLAAGQSSVMLSQNSVLPAIAGFIRVLLDGSINGAARNRNLNDEQVEG